MPFYWEPIRVIQQQAAGSTQQAAARGCLVCAATAVCIMVASPHLSRTLHITLLEYCRTFVLHVTHPKYDTATRKRYKKMNNQNQEYYSLQDSVRLYLVHTISLTICNGGFVRERTSTRYDKYEKPRAHYVCSLSK